MFRNTENGYTVFQMVTDDEELTCVGVFSVISEGELIQVSGTMKEHPLYGEQLQAEQYELLAPEDETAMERYLGSGAIKGIGAAMAARIVRRFKGDTFRIIEEEPERLAEVKGISERKAMEISEQMAEKKELRQAMMFLTQYGISMSLAVKIYQEYGPKTYQVVQENPYRLADDISGIGFKMADEIAGRIGIHTNSDYRIRSGLLYVLLQAAAEGHTCLPREMLLRRASELLHVAAEDIEVQMMNLCMDRKLILKEKNDQTMVFYSQYYYMELNTARMLHDLNLTCRMEEEDILKKLQAVERQEKMELLEGIRDESRWLIRMVENLLSITRINGDRAQLQTTWEVVEEVVGGAVEKFQKQFAQIEVETSMPEEVVMAPMDGILVEQVLVNLMENSAIHGKTTTKIRISVQKLPERVLFCVEDNGKGIDPAILPIIFEGQLPTGDHAASDGKRSMGIGLSVCMSIIQAHQGDMKAENMAAHRGARIQFWLPCQEENWMEEA